jgi:hypothetical protein
MRPKALTGAFKFHAEAFGTPDKGAKHTGRWEKKQGLQYDLPAF